MNLVVFDSLYCQIIMKIGSKLQSWFRRRRNKAEKNTGMVLTVTEDTPADMLAGSMELLVQLPREHHIHTQRVTVERSTAMMDLLVQIATAHKLAASNYTLQAIGERGLVLPHQPNTPIGALDALEVKLLPKQGTLISRKTKQLNQPFETTFRLQVHLPRNQLYVSRVSPKTNLGDILDQVCREKNLNKNKYELRHPGNHKEVLDLSSSLQDYQLQEVTLYAKQGQSLGLALSSQDIIALQRQEERRRQQAKQGVFGFIFRKSKENSLSTDSYGDRSVSPARSDETGRSVSPLAPPTRPQRKRRPAPSPPVRQTTEPPQKNNDVVKDESKEKLVISHSRNSSDSSGYHEASVLSDNLDSAGRMPETLPRRSRLPGKFESRKLAHTSQASKSLCNLAMSSGGLSHANSNTSLSSTGIRKKRAAPQPPTSRPLSAAISTQALERIVDSEESLTSDMGISKPPSDIACSSETETNSKANSDIAIGGHASMIDSKNYHCTTQIKENTIKCDDIEKNNNEHLSLDDKSNKNNQYTSKQPSKPELTTAQENKNVGIARVASQAGTHAPTPKPRSNSRGYPVVPPRAATTALSTKPVNSLINELEKNSSHATNPAAKTDNIESIENYSEIDSRNFIHSIQQLNNNEQIQEQSHKFNNNHDNTDGNNELKQTKNTKNNNHNNNEATPGVSIEEEVSQSSNNQVMMFKNQTEINSKKVVIKDELKKNESSLFKKQLDMEMNMLDVKNKVDKESSQDTLSENNTPSGEQSTIPPLVTCETNLGLQMDLTHSNEEGELHSQGTGKAGNDKSETETDRLLHKVSSTLASVSPSYEKDSCDADLEEADNLKKTNQLSLKNSASHLDEADLNNTSNSTLNSQQDTSDYVSANGEDLSGHDWEYQLPDPPSAFRDNVTSDYDGYDTITLGSVEAFKEPLVKPQEETPKVSLETHNKPVKPKIEAVLERNNTRKADKVSSSEILHTNSSREMSRETVQQNAEIELKKNIISELETKIENGSLNQINKTIELESRKSSQTSTPKIAPVENTLPNFTITTYSRQKSLNIYDSPEKSPTYITDCSQDRIVKTFATLSRNVSSFSNNKDNYFSFSKINPPNGLIDNNRKIIRTQSIQNINNKVTKDNNLLTEDLNSSKIVNDKSEIDKIEKSNIVHRSKSYIVLTNNSKYRDNKPSSSDVIDNGNIIKSTSVTNLNQINILVDEKAQVKQKSPKNLNSNLQEKELQSVQVLKSILPQLKNAQQSEKNTQNVFESKKQVGDKPLQVSGSQMQLNSDENKTLLSDNKNVELENNKRYRYTGPPSVSLGSWNERSSVHVQIKMDTDYKFGVKDNTSGAKTVVSLNSSSNDVDLVDLKDNYLKNLPKNHASTVKNNNNSVSNEIKPMIKQVTNNEITKNIITTSVNNKKLEFNNLGFAKLRAIPKGENKPVVTNMELKKSYIEKPELTDDHAKIDTRPVNFQELTQTFGQVNLRTKPKYQNSQNRHSDYLDSRLNKDLADKKIIKSLEYENSNEIKNPTVKKYTSIVDIDNKHLTNGFRNNSVGKIPINTFNNSITKINGPSSTTTTVLNKDFQVHSFKDNPQSANLSVKGNGHKEIKLTVNNNNNNNIISYIPPPPSMPIITGVTLKNNSTRPKSIPIDKDPRDQLLESIRSFGREKLKNVSIVS